MTDELVLTDDPAERVRRIALNRPGRRHALNGPLRGQLLDAIRAADGEPELGVVVLQGAGPDSCAGYDLDPGSDAGKHGTSGSGEGRFQREVLGWLALSQAVVRAGSETSALASGTGAFRALMDAAADGHLIQGLDVPDHAFGDGHTCTRSTEEERA